MKNLFIGRASEPTSVVLQSVILATLFLVPFDSVATDGLYPLTPIEQSMPSDAELAPLDVLATTDILGIGESAHGVRGYMRIQNRLIQYFVEKHGFRQIYLENELFATGPASKYVRDGTGTVKDAVSAMWNANQEYVEIFEWLRKWNQTHPADPVELLGADIYETPYLVHQVLVSQLKPQDAFFKNEIVEIEKSCAGHTVTSDAEWKTLKQNITSGTATITDADFGTCMSSLKSIRQKLQSDPKLKTELGSDAFYDALLATQVLYARQNHMKRLWVEKNKAAHWNVRDETLAQNILTQREKYGASQKVLWIAHTSHTSQATSKAAWWSYGLGLGQILGTGEFLAKSVNYKSIGTTGFDIEGQNGRFETPSSPLSLDLQLRSSGANTVLVDTRGSFCSFRKKWWVQNENNNLYYPDGVFLTPAEHFDFYIFIDSSLKAAPL
ncbi:MAG: erythromycin esterase family protein [Bdellovibrionales bacterium]|nr:erythromycin esterase family protein [Bdellovibrionales bacterium]